MQRSLQSRGLLPTVGAQYHQWWLLADPGPEAARHRLEWWNTEQKNLPLCPDWREIWCAIICTFWNSVTTKRAILKPDGVRHVSFFKQEPPYHFVVILSKYQLTCTNLWLHCTHTDQLQTSHGISTGTNLLTASTQTNYSIKVATIWLAKISICFSINSLDKAAWAWRVKAAPSEICNLFVGCYPSKTLSHPSSLLPIPLCIQRFGC